MRGKQAAEAALTVRGVCARFGAMAEVVVGSGNEFRDAFERELKTMSVDLRVTSREHPQSNGAAERVMQGRSLNTGGASVTIGTAMVIGLAKITGKIITP